jgi:putative aldouronate transport system substrate-binding protein
MNENEPDWKVEWFEIASKDIRIRPRAFIQGGSAVPTTAKDITRSLIALETIRQDQALFDLNFYGIEGVHWTLDPQGNVIANSQEYLPGAATGTAAWRMDKFIKPIAGAWTKWDELQVDWFANRAIYNPLPGFVFNSEALKNELAAIANVDTEYAKPLSWGMVEPAKGLAELNQKLDEAGRRKVMDERTAQIKQFAQDNNIKLGG